MATRPGDRAAAGSRPKVRGRFPNYYRLEAPDGTKDSRPEALLATIENAVARIVHELAGGAVPSAEDRAWLALFIVLQHRRTPVAREWLKFQDELMSTLMFEVDVGNVESFHRSVRTVGADASYDDIEGVRNELVEDFATGRITVTSTPSREVAFMFIAADKIAATLATSFSLGVARAPAGVSMSSPTGITMYDPTPRFPGSGAGFASSPNVESVLPVDPSFAIVVMPGLLGWADAVIDEEAVDEVNLRSYAWSHAAVYGQSQKVVTDLRRLARRKSVDVARFKPRRGRLWIAEGDEGKKTGELEFVGHSPEGQTRARFVVHPEAYDDDVKYPG